jgi:protein-tyrosine phosphatase
VLFVCHANICRSPYAAAAARRRLPVPTVSVASAGFIGPERSCPPEAVAVAAEHGIDLAEHRSQLIGPEHLRDVDLVVTMDQRQRRRLLSGRPRFRDRVVVLGDLDPEPVTSRAVLDPVGQPAEVFQICYNRIDRCVGVLAASWRERPAGDAQTEGRELD